jgi:hypothetical protein
MHRPSTMAKKVLIVLAAGSLTVGTPTAVAAFSSPAGLLGEMLQRAFKPSPELVDSSKALEQWMVAMHLDINGSGKELKYADAAERMSIQHVVFNLREQLGAGQQPGIPMPGFSGPHPGTSGGVGRLEIVKPGHYITMTGLEHPKFDAANANWELIWRKDSPAGALICGLDLTQDAIRNRCRVGKGRMYVSFPIWKRDKLDEYQAYKRETNELAERYLSDRDDELRKMQSTTNLFAKALHYRNAAEAVEKYSLQPLRSMATVPDEKEIFAVARDLFLTKTGTVWQKNPGTWGSERRQVFLGAATIDSVVSLIENQKENAAAVLETDAWKGLAP